MKTLKKSIFYISAVALGMAATASLTGCDDNFERPPMVVPTATIEANTTIADLKTAFFQTAADYASLVGTKADGSHYIIEGYVTTSDQAGNYFKQLVIQDETSAIQLSIDMYDLYQSYQPGQKLVLDCTGLYLGAYGNLMQLGAAPTTKEYPSRIPEAEMTAAAQLDGLSKVENTIEPAVVTVAELRAMTTTSAEGLQWQNRLIEIQDVTFQNAGKQTLSTAGSNGVSQNFGNAEGQVILYTSGYSDFYQYYCPTGTGTVRGILSCFKNNWQVRLIDVEGLIGFDELTEEGNSTPGNPGEGDGDGTEAKPYTVAQVQGGATGTDVWVKGYIVGWVEGQVLADGAKFNASATVQTNILIADTKDANTVAACIPVQLPAGDVRTALNLQTNPGNLGKEVLLKGSLEKYFSTAGLKSVSQFKLEGGTPDTPDTPVEPVATITENFENGSIPAGWTQVQVAGNKAWYVTSFNENYYAAMTGYKGTAPFDQYLISAPVDMSKAEVKNLNFRTQVNGYSSTTSKLEVYVITDPANPATGATKLDVALATAPASGYSDWVQSGNIDLSKFTGTVYIAFRYSATTDANYATWCVDDVKVNVK